MAIQIVTKRNAEPPQRYENVTGQPMNPRTIPELLEAHLMLVRRVEALERQLAEKPQAKPAAERMREYRARKRQKDA